MASTRPGLHRALGDGVWRVERTKTGIGDDTSRSRVSKRSRSDEDTAYPVRAAAGRPPLHGEGGNFILRRVCCTFNRAIFWFRGCMEQVKHPGLKKVRNPGFKKNETSYRNFRGVIGTVNVWRQDLTSNILGTNSGQVGSSCRRSPVLSSPWLIHRRPLLSGPGGRRPPGMRRTGHDHWGLTLARLVWF